MQPLLIITAALVYQVGSFKLVPKVIGPFEILKIINTVVVRLKLPSTMMVNVNNVQIKTGP